VIKIEEQLEILFQDLRNIERFFQVCCTVEEYIEAKYDLHVFKIGSNYKALM
jgi:hypothetical protein